MAKWPLCPPLSDAHILNIMAVLYGHEGVEVPPVSDNRMLEITSHSPEETRQFGVRLGELAQPGDLYCLEGELGSGKTCFVQGIGKGLGIAQAIHSPTFILANEHPGGRLPLYHLDVYRVRGPDEAVGFGLEDYAGGEGVCVIEWAEKIRPALAPEHLWITFRHAGESERRMVLRATGKRYRELLQELEKDQGSGDAARH